MKIGFLGGSKITTTIINGIINSNNFQKDNFKIVVKTNKSCEKWQNANFSASTKWESLNECQVIILTLLPQDIYELQTNLKTNFNNKIIISIASGVTIKKLREIFNNCYIAQIMTNTSCQFNQATIMICTESDEIAKNKTAAIFKFCGSLINLSETKIHEFIAIYGSAAGGTTIAAIDIFNKNNVKTIINDALTASINRSKILEKNKN